MVNILPIEMMILGMVYDWVYHIDGLRTGIDGPFSSMTDPFFSECDVPVRKL